MNSLQPEQCRICFVDFESNDATVSCANEVSHLFHHSCLEKWVLTGEGQDKELCPAGCKSKVVWINGPPEPDNKPTFKTLAITGTAFALRAFTAAKLANVFVSRVNLDHFWPYMRMGVVFALIDGTVQMTAPIVTRRASLQAQQLYYLVMHTLPIVVSAFCIAKYENPNSSLLDSATYIQPMLFSHYAVTFACFLAFVDYSMRFGESR